MTSPTPGGTDAATLIAYAATHLGKKYVYGKAGPDTFDCSGFVQYVFKQYGMSLPHHAADQAKAGKAVDPSSILPGDLVFSDWGSGPNSHVGIATSSGQIIDAPHTGAVVRYDSLSSNYLAHVTAVRRMTGVTQGTSTRPAAQGGDVTTGTNSTGTGNNGGAGNGADTGDDTAGGLDASVFDQLAGAIRSAFQPLTSLSSVADQLYKAFLPSNLIRIVAGIAGAIFIGWGTILLAREVKS